jgi:hypothetical protein
MADDDGGFPRVPLRRRLLVALLAVATAVTLFVMMLERIGAPEIPRPPPPAAPAVCAEGQLSGCLGGKAEVIVVPAAAAAPASAGSGR